MIVSERRRKYEPEQLVAMFRLAARLREEMRAADFTDNGGAIHSAERILNILGLALKYPGLTHINNLRNWPGAQFSEAARIAHANHERVMIEHVSPLRALARRAIELVANGVADDELVTFVRERFCLVLLTEAETSRLNKLNRSQMTEDPLERLRQADIALAPTNTV